MSHEHDSVAGLFDVADTGANRVCTLESALRAEAAMLESLIPALPHPARELAAAQLEALRPNRESMSAWIAGEYTDAESGFVYLRARYYDPATGQFLSVDPLATLTRETYPTYTTTPSTRST